MKLVGEDETAYSHRAAGRAISINAAWLEGDESRDRYVIWTQAFWVAR